jgi:dTDP-4-amino-4,6-dideoxygalactose transaminase
MASACRSDGANVTEDAPLPYNLPDITDAEIDAVVETLRSGWLAPGPRARLFENDFARRAGARHAIALDSATAGLHLALVALGIGPGDEVITTPTTFAATINTIIHTGARPVLADITIDNYCIDPAAVERAMTPRTRAIMPVHHGGSPCDMRAILDLAAHGRLRVIEDAAHALGTAIGDRPIGAFGDATVFSFYPTKNVTSGRGGMLTTDDDALAERCRLLALHGLSRDAWDRYAERGTWAYQVLAPGYNYAMSDLQAALGHAQLARLDAFQAKRRTLASLYAERLAEIPCVIVPRERAGTTHAWHLYVVRLSEDAGVNRDELMAKLRERAIGASVHFIPIHHHPYYREAYGWAPGDFPVADEAFRTMVSLPLYTRMSHDDVERVVAALRDILMRKL